MAEALKDKIPPHNEEAEKATLGAMLLEAEAVPVAMQYLNPGDFYINRNRQVFEAIRTLSDQGLKADIITIVEELRRTGELDGAGGPAYVASLTNVVPTAANIEYYAKVVQDCSLRRALVRVSNETVAKSFDESQESRIILEETQQRIFELTDSRQTLTFKSIKEIIPPLINLIETRYHSKNQYTGIPSGFDDLDQYTSGFQPSELIIIGARPSIGKTALALTMATNIAIHRKIPTAFFTLEMSDIALVQRLVSGEANIESNALRLGKLKPSEFTKLLDAAGKIYEAPLYIVDMPNMKLLDLRSQARRLRAQQKVEIIFIDYLTLISSNNYQLPRHEQVAEISRSLKSLARELGIPVVALSQVRRELDVKRGGEHSVRPGLADLRESGSIEQDADLVIFLHRDRKIEQNSGETEIGPGTIPTELIIAKQRNGPVGIVNIVFHAKFAKFAPQEKNS
jgi:replicative DNA helicase